ncbi:hypothetical protein ACFX15_035256 [Malus domestica]
MDNCLAHYDEVLNPKGMVDKTDVFHIVSGMWKSASQKKEKQRWGKAKAKEKQLGRKQPGHPFSTKGATCSTEATRTPTKMFSISVTITP